MTRNLARKPSKNFYTLASDLNLTHPWVKEAFFTHRCVNLIPVCKHLCTEFLRYALGIGFSGSCFIQHAFGHLNLLLLIPTYASSGGVKSSNYRQSWAATVRNVPPKKLPPLRRKACIKVSPIKRNTPFLICKMAI
jgi:hypothetical protein